MNKKRVYIFAILQFFIHNIPTKIIWNCDSVTKFKIFIFTFHNKIDLFGQINVLQKEGNLKSLFQFKLNLSVKGASRLS